MRLFLGLALVVGLGYAKVVVNRAGYFSFSNSESTPSLYTFTQKYPKVTFLKFFKKSDKTKILTYTIILYHMIKVAWPNNALG